MAEGPVKLLSIDGGGVRGLSALVMLEQLVYRTNSRRKHHGLEPQAPWQMFDMIAGTSTGGLIAVMLGRLRMSIEDCIDAYMKLSEKAFTQRNMVSKAAKKATLGPAFHTTPLEEAIKMIIGKEREDDLLRDDGSPCKVFVVAHLQNNNDTAILRTYRNDCKTKGSLDEMRIWQACRATSAALTFFKPIIVDELTYSDGGLKENNPIQQLHGEASEMFPDRQQVIVSLGTGTQSTKAFDPNLFNVTRLLASLATETEDQAENFYRRNNCKEARENRYFRFNVPGLGDIGLDECTQLRKIKIETESFLNKSETSEKVRLCIEKFTEDPSVSKNKMLIKVRPISMTAEINKGLPAFTRAVILAIDRAVVTLESWQQHAERLGQIGLSINLLYAECAKLKFILAQLEEIVPRYEQASLEDKAICEALKLYKVLLNGCRLLFPSLNSWSEDLAITPEECADLDAFEGKLKSFWSHPQMESIPKMVERLAELANVVHDAFRHNNPLEIIKTALARRLSRRISRDVEPVIDSIDKILEVQGHSERRESTMKQPRESPIREGVATDRNGMLPTLRVHLPPEEPARDPAKKPDIDDLEVPTITDLDDMNSSETIRRHQVSTFERPFPTTHRYPSYRIIAPHTWVLNKYEWPPGGYHPVNHKDLQVAWSDDNWRWVEHLLYPPEVDPLTIILPAEFLRDAPTLWLELLMNKEFFAAQLLLDHPMIDLDVHHCYIFSERVLNYFVHQSGVDAVRMVLQAGANVDGYLDSDNPLLQCIESNRNLDAKNEIVRILIKAGADVNRYLKLDGGTVLNHFVLGEDADIVELIIRAGADINGCGDSEPPLIKCIQENTGYYGRSNMVKSLLELGADINGRGLLGELPLVLALRIQEFSLAGILLAEGADADLVDKISNTTARDEIFALFASEESLAKAEGSLIGWVWRQLIESGGRIAKWRHGPKRRTLLHVVAEHRNAEALAKLLIEDERVDRWAADLDGKQPWELARPISKYKGLFWSEQRKPTTREWPYIEVVLSPEEKASEKEIRRKIKQERDEANAARHEYNGPHF